MNLGSDLIYYVIAILVALVIHEFTHALVGHLLGDTTAQREGRLSLNPLHHIDPMMTVVLPIVTIVLFGFPMLAAKPVPFDPDQVDYGEFGAAMIAAAGPLSNLLLAIVAALLLHSAAPGSVFAHFLSIFEILNVALFVFNMIPIPPLDGSRVLYAFAPEPVQEIMRSIEPYGLFVVFGLVLLGGGSIFSNLIDAVIRLLP